MLIHLRKCRSDIVKAIDPQIVSTMPMVEITTKSSLWKKCLFPSISDVLTTVSLDVANGGPIDHKGPLPGDWSISLSPSSSSYLSLQSAKRFLQRN